MVQLYIFQLSSKMKKIYLILIVLIVSSSILLYNKSYEISNSISGTITDQSSNAIYSNIYLLQNSKPIYNFQTDKSTGSFSTSIQSGTYQVVFTQLNQTYNEPRFFYLNRTATINSAINVNLIFPTITITGQITDSNNSPVSNALIDSGVGKVSISGYVGSVQDYYKTDSNGNYVLHLFPGTFSNVKITLSNGLTFYPTSGKSVTVTTSGTHDIKLATPVTVTGTIIDQSSNPALAKIELVKDDLVESIITDKSTGSFSFNVQPNQYLVKISSVNQTNNLPRFFDAEKTIDLSSSGTASLTLPIQNWSGVGLKNNNGTLFNGFAQIYMPINFSGWTGFSGDQIQVSNGSFNLKLINPYGTIAKESFGTTNMVICSANNVSRTINC